MSRARNVAAHSALSYQTLQRRYAELSRQTRRIYGASACAISLTNVHSARFSSAGLIVFDTSGTALSPHDSAPSPFDLRGALDLLVGEGDWLLSDPENEARCVQPPRGMTPDDLPWAS